MRAALPGPSAAAVRRRAIPRHAATAATPVPGHRHRPRPRPRPRPRCRRAAVTARRMLAIIASRPLRDAALIIWSGPMRSCGCRSSRRSPRLTSRCSRTAPARSPCAASKTDQEGRGHVRYLGPPTVAAVNRWPQAAGISAGPLFRRVRRGDVMGTKPLERAQRPGDRRQASDRRRHHRAGVRALTPARLGSAQSLAAAGGRLGRAATGG